MALKVLIPVLGDQLSVGLSALRAVQREDAVVLMAEVAAEAGYVWHHRQKLAFIFAAMRHFAEDLRAAGWRVRYIRLDDPDNGGTLAAEVARAIAELAPERIVATWPGEWRVLEDMRQWAEGRVEILEDTRFVCDHATFERWARDRRQLRMEFFYREMRQRTGLLMDGELPAGGRWNFDAENRKAPPRHLTAPSPPGFVPDATTRDVMAMVARRFPDNPGRLEPFTWAVTATDAQRAATHFLHHALPSFGDFQDAMLRDEPYLFHSLLSPYLNTGLLDPLALCRAAEAEYLSGRAPLSAVEGFIRQIIGWREYVRGIYWREGPDYVRRNALAADRPLPDFYWTGETDMACLRTAISQTLDNAYAHHIQRLMITGNFALLAGIDPHALHEWYLSVYADAFEWVEAPNTIGMSQFADGGLLASKPYAASGNYINRMSDYCRNCHYDVKQKTGTQACPFNYLYWDFVARHRTTFGRNPRLAQVYRTYAHLGDVRQREIAVDSARFLAALKPVHAGPNAQ